jgi:phospholipase D1/2
VFVLAGVLLIPLELLMLVAGVYYGVLHGGAVALAGSLATALIGYAAGRAIGPAALTNWISRRSYRSIRQLSMRGLVGFIVLRLASVASAGSIHLLSGAGRVAFWTYLVGTIIGLAPVIVAITGLGSLLRRTLLNPTLSNGLTTIGAAVLLIALLSGLRAILLVRQFASTVSSHRDRAEFG